MIDKQTLEKQLQELQGQHERLFRQSEQVLGAILYAQSLLKLIADKEAAVSPPQQEREGE